MADSFEKMAQMMVEATSKLVSNRTVNIMNTKGIILASTEKERIGTLHTGAAKAARTGKPVYIAKKDVSKYAGAKEGCNMPIFDVDNKLIGVVGMYGNPEEVADAANLLAVYTRQYFALKAESYKEQAEKELRSKALELLISPGGEGLENGFSLCESLHTRLNCPVRIILLDAQNELASVDLVKIGNSLLRNLFAQGLLNSDHDLAGIVDTHPVLLKSNTDKLDLHWLQHVYELAKHDFPSTKLCLGSICTSLKQLPSSYQDVIALKDLPGSGICDINTPALRCQFILDRTSKQETSYLQGLQDKLNKCLSPVEAEEFLKTAKIYYEENGSITKAAPFLHVHKNTVQYRLHKLESTLELDALSAFEKEFLIRLCINKNISKK